MKYRVVYNFDDGIRRVTNSGGHDEFGYAFSESTTGKGSSFEFDSLESAKRATAKYVKANQLREGSFIVVELPSYKIVSTFNFPPPPPLEGWVDTK